MEKDIIKGECDEAQKINLSIFQAYSIYDKAVGYCQGSMFIAGMLLMKVKMRYNLLTNFAEVYFQ